MAQSCKKMFPSFFTLSCFQSVSPEKGLSEEEGGNFNYPPPDLLTSLRTSWIFLTSVLLFLFSSDLLLHLSIFKRQAIPSALCHCYVKAAMCNHH